VKEEELLADVRELIAEHRLLGYHTHDSRRSERGFPDLVICGRRVLFRELKTTEGTMSGPQARWKWRLLATGADWGIWTPEDLASGRIERELTEIS